MADFFNGIGQLRRLEFAISIGATKGGSSKKPVVHDIAGRGAGQPIHRGIP